MSVIVLVNVTTGCIGSSTVFSYNRRMTDTATASDQPIQVVTTFGRNIVDNVETTDSVVPVVMFTRSMVDNAAVSDSDVTTQLSRLLSNSVQVGDVISSVVYTHIRTIVDNVQFADAAIQQLGFFNIDTRNGTLLSGATYTVTPNPYTGSGSLTVIDGNVATDADATNNGRIIVSDVPVGTYVINQTAIPSGVIPVTTIGQISVHGTAINPTITFNLVNDTTTFANSDVIDIENVDIDIDVFAELEFPIQLTKVTNGVQETITSVDDLPTMKFAGINNTNALTNATASQSSLLYKSLSELGRDEEADTIINAFRLNATDTGNSTSLAYVGIMTATGESGVYGQYLATQPVDSFNCGQRYIFPLDDTLLTSYGGIKNVDFTTSADGTCTATKDYITYEVSRTPPSTAAPTLDNNGINEDTLLYINAQFPASLTNGTGFDFGNSTNLDSYTLTIQSAMPETGKIDDLTVYIYDEINNKWITSGVNVLSRTQSGSFAELEVLVDHTSKFSVGGKRSPSSPSGDSSSAAGGTGRVGVSTSSGASVGGVPSESSTPSITNVDSVYYNVCDENIVRIILSGEIPSNVIIRTTHSGIVTAKPAIYQPYAIENDASDVKYVYEAPIASHETYFVVSVDGIIDESLQGIQIVGCEGNTILVQEDPRVKPQIFDFKFQMGVNGTQIRPIIGEYYYQESNEDVTVSAIVDSAYSSLRRAELRISDELIDTSYTSIRMDIEELTAISNTTSIVRATLPVEMLKSPATQFWIHAINDEGKSNDSKYAILGVADPQTDYTKIDIEMDTQLAKAQGQTYRPTAYINNAGDKPIYGEVSLHIDEVVVDKHSMMFVPGESNVEFEWTVPKQNSLTSYDVTAVVDTYGHEQQTSTAVLKTYDRSESILLNDFNESLNYIVDESGNTIARPALIYASLPGQSTELSSPEYLIL